MPQSDFGSVIKLFMSLSGYMIPSRLLCYVLSVSEDAAEDLIIICVGDLCLRDSNTIPDAVCGVSRLHVVLK